MNTVSRCEGIGTDDIPLTEGEIVYEWNGYNECWMGIDQDGRTAYVPEEGPGELPGCADPMSLAGRSA